MEMPFLGVILIYISEFSELIVTWLASLTQPTNITVVNTTNQHNSVTEFFTILGFMHLKSNWFLANSRTLEAQFLRNLTANVFRRTLTRLECAAFAFRCVPACYR